MNIEQEEVTVNNPATGTTQVTQSTKEVASHADVTEAKAAKKNQIIWYIAGAINALLALRILFLLLGAREVGFATILYSITNPFTALFQGVFASPAVSGAYFDSAAVLAILIYSLLAWGLSALLDVVSRPAPQ
jgi:hypothetical protein